MKERIEFEVGQAYENRKGKYKVIMIDGDSRTIRWKGGEETVTTMMIQQAIMALLQKGGSVCIETKPAMSYT